MLPDGAAVSVDEDIKRLRQEDWLEFYRQPKSVIFNGAAQGWDVLRSLIEEGRIVNTGRTDRGGHQLFQTREASDTAGEQGSWIGEDTRKEDT